MRNIIRLFKRDCANISRSVIGLVVVVGLVIIPCLYAWFNIAGSWDPYGNTGNLKVAVANSDEGYQSDLIPVKVNMGDSVVNALRANDGLDWVFVDEDRAVEGVKAGDYYAAVVIPKDFSAKMMTLFATHVEHAQIDYYENQKMNAIAPRVTDKGASTVRQQIDTTFTETVSDVGLTSTSGLLDFMDSDKVENYVANLSATLGDGISSLRDAASNTGSYASLLGSTADLVSTTGNLLGSTEDTSKRSKDLLADAKSGLGDIESGLGDVTATINKALADSSSSFDDVQNALDKALRSAGDDVQGAISWLRQAANSLDARASEIDGDGGLISRVEEFEKTYGLQLNVLKTALQSVATKQHNQADRLIEAAEKLEGKLTEADADYASAQQVITEAKQSISQLQSDYEGTLKDQAGQLESTISGITTSAQGISDSLNQTVNGLSTASDSLASDLKKVNGILADSSQALSDTGDNLQKVKDELDAAAQSGDLDKIRGIIGNDPEALADALAAPVGLETHSVYHIKNYGSAMAPFYTSVSLWVGGIVLAAMMKVAVDDKLVAELSAPVRLHHLYLGRFCLFGALSLCQSTLMLAGELLFFGIQCQNPLQYLLAGWVGGLMFVLFIYTLTVSFGDIGKALAVVLLVMQVGGSGGTFPIEMTASFFQSVYPFLPAAHLINAMHAAMAGGWGAEYWIELGCVALYFIPILALGLLLRRPVIRANDWIIEKMESTKLM